MLVLLAIPFLSMRLGSADAGSDPSGSTTRKAYDLLAKGFGPGYNGPLQLVAQVSGPAQEAAFVRVARAVASTPGVVGLDARRVHPRPCARAAGVALANVYPKGSPQDASTSNLLHTVRDQVVPAAERGTGVHVLVGGQTAIFDDFAEGAVAQAAAVPRDRDRAQLPAADGRVPECRDPGSRGRDEPAVGRGGVRRGHPGVPGRGRLRRCSGSTRPDRSRRSCRCSCSRSCSACRWTTRCSSSTRIYEEWHRRRNNAEAVAHGLAATGKTITAAAAIMILVFGAFILGGQRIIDLFGVGLASAVLLDALIVRSVLVPALMLIIGDANWWLPGWLDDLLPHLRVEGATARATGRHGAAERGRTGAFGQLTYRSVCRGA